MRASATPSPSTAARRSFDGGIVTRLDCVPLGIVVNRDAQRFYDEGEDVWPKRYAIWGKLIARQPGQIAYSIVDAKVRGRFMPSVFPPLEAPSIRELAAQLSLPVDAARSDGRGVQPRTSGPARSIRMRSTIAAPMGLTPDKTHWAQRIDTPPFAGYPLKTGITFTYLGVRVDAQARVLGSDGTPFANVYAAGEIMAGNVLRQGYIAGIGMTIGTVFGRIAGESAAQHAGH